MSEPIAQTPQPQKSAQLQTFSRGLAELLLHEVSPAWSREGVPIATGHAVRVGSVLACVDDGHINGTWQPITADTASRARGIACEAVAADAGHRQCVVLARGAVVAAHALVWPEGASSEHKAAALSALRSAGIVVREALA